MQPSWFTVLFVRDITELSKLNSEHIRISFYSTNKLREFIRVHKDSLSHKKSNVIRSRIRAAM